MADDQEKKPPEQEQEQDVSPPPKQESISEDKLEQVADESEQGDLGQDSDDDHEVVHNDEAPKEDERAIRRVNVMLMGLSLLGFIITLGAILYLFSNFETFQEFEVEEPVEPLISLSGNLYYQSSPSDGSATFYAVGEDSQSVIITPETAGALEPANEGRNRTWQTTRDGDIIAYQLDGQDTVRVLTPLGQDEAFSDTPGQLQDWVITSDGRYVFGLFTGNSLARYDTALKTSEVVDSDFTANGDRGEGRIHYGADGTIRWFTFNGTDRLSVILYRVGDNSSTDPLVIESPRFPDNAQVEHSSLSPDGQAMIFSFVSGGRDYLGLTSLNSGTVRTIYEAGEGAALEDFIWAPDSRTLAITERQGPGVARVVKLDTGPITTDLLIDRSTDGLSAQNDIAQNISFSPDSLQVTFINGSKLYGVTLEDKSLNALLEPLQPLGELESYGWINIPKAD